MTTRPDRRDMFTRALPTRTACAAAAVAAMLAAGGCRTSSSPRTDSSPTAQPGDVGGRLLLSLGDADLPAATPGEALLADRSPGSRDALTVVSLPIVEPTTPSMQIDVSNSAFGSPACLAISPDGRHAYVVESRGAGGEGSARPASSLPAGESLTTIDISTPMAPANLGATYVGPEPQAVAVHPAGDLLAVVTRNPRNQLVMIPLSGGVPGEPASWPLLGLDDDQAAPSCVAWHPSGRALAVTLPDRGEVVFYAFARESDGALAIAAWGTPVKVGPRPTFAAFTPDGRHLITVDAGGSEGSGEAGAALPSAGGQVSVVRVSENLASIDDATTAHAVIDRAAVGVGPVGAAVSPDGSLIACANSTGAAGGGGGSISLFGVRSDGTLAAAGEYPVGAVPAGVSFDRAGRFVLVSQYRSLDPEASEGEVSFWKVVSGSAGPTLVQQDFFLGIGAGPHGTLIVR